MRADILPAQATTVRRLWPACAAAILFLLALLLFSPGVAMYDTVRQYEQALSGHYNDWHPPIMARLWSWLIPLGRGTEPMLALQLAGYWLGLGLLAQALGGRKAVAILALGASPLFLGWQIVVLKDGQMAGALLSALGLVAAWRLRGRPVPWWALGLVLLCLAYATLLRANAPFSTVPLAVLMLAPGKRLRIALPAILIGIAAVILVSQPVNHQLLEARDSGVSRSEAIFDLAAIAANSGDAAASGLTDADVAVLRTHRCVKPLFWDPLFVREDCDNAVDALDHMKSGPLYVLLAGAILRHPIAYATHRIAHLNATLRWLVPFRWPLAYPPAENEPNKVGLADPPCCVILGWQIASAAMIETPLGWPILWLMLGFWGLIVASRAPPGPRRDLAFALLASALCQEASFAILSLSSDLRYHLWAMLAVAIAWILLWEARPTPRQSNVALAVLALVALAGLGARLSLPVPPWDYDQLVK